MLGTPQRSKPRVLLVEDDEKLGAQVMGYLNEAGYDVDWLRDGRDVLRADPHAYQLWVLDLMLPNAYGLDILKRVRQSSDVPVLVLSAQCDAHVMVRALQLGSDDFMRKPFWREEFLARVEARMRRPTALQDDCLHLDGLVVDLARRRLLIDEQEIELTRVEFDLLAHLARRYGAAVQRSALAEAVLDPDRAGTERTLDVHVSRLRKKLGRCSAYVSTVWGVGYRLEGPRQ